MIKFRIQEILNEQDRSAYWLESKMNMDYHNVKKLVDNETSMIRLSTLDKLVNILNVPIEDLFKDE